LKTAKNLEIGNWVETRLNCLVLSPILFTPPTRTSCPCRRCEQTITLRHGPCTT